MNRKTFLKAIGCGALAPSLLLNLAKAYNTKLVISETCIACDACVPECPSEAIEEGDPIYIINQEACTWDGYLEACEGENVPCARACPEPDCIIEVVE